MSDLGERLTGQALSELEARIAGVYRAAADELQGTIEAYFEGFAKRDGEMKALIGQTVNGRVWTEQDYAQWRLNQIGRGERYQALRERIAQRYTRANETAVTYVNDATGGLYALNRNYAAYTIEQVAGDVGFDLWDEQTVRRLLVEQPGLMPYYPPERALKRGIDLAYGRRQITASVTSSILQGKGLKAMADDLQTRMRDMNRDSAIRTARTAVTGAQNAGRMDSYAAAERMGLTLKKRWRVTLDGRTRHSHARLDGETVLPGERFSNGCRFPGDPQGPAHEVYNCRCTLVADLPGMGVGNAPRRARSPLTGRNEVVRGQTYAEWVGWKQDENKTAWDTYIKKDRTLSSDRAQWQEYRKALGENVSNTLEDFRNLKYNEPERWKQLKTDKRQMDFVNNAPCVTTPKKFKGYFLKPGAKHADQFFRVGYTENDVLQLRYDIARQFDMGKAVDVLENNDGSTKFNIYMKLGATKERTFCTGWRIDKPGDTPRIITAFRSERGAKNAE